MRPIRGLGLRRATAAGLAAAALSTAVALPAWAGAAPTVRIRDASLAENGDVRLVVSVGGDAATRPLSASDVAVRENGTPVTGVAVAPLSAASAGTAVVLAIDVSGSTAGKPLADAKAGAAAFLTKLDPAVRVALVAFGDRAVVRSGLTADRAAIRRAVDALAAGGSTALYDAIALSAGTLKPVKGRHAIVVFSDGRDTVERTTLAAAIAAAKAAAAPVHTVALSTRSSDPVALDRVARGTLGSVVLLDASAGLAAAFAAVATELSTLYTISYKGTVTTADLSIEVSLALAGAGAAAVADRVVVANPREGAPPPLPPAVAPKPLIPGLDGKAGLAIGILAAFGFIAIFGSLLGWRSAKSAGWRTLAKGIAAIEGHRRARKAAVREASSLGSIGRATEGVLQRTARTRGFEARLQRSLDRAGWPMRASEFVVLQAGSALVGLSLAWALSGVWWIGVAGGAGAAFAPRIVLSQRVARRQAAFLSQLPDTLQLLAGSLQAGYGFLQAVDTLVKECPEPTAHEFGRVLTETRLGMPMDVSLVAMAERIGSDDFSWVVMAITIQREVGGNLAELLRTVAQTLRDREQVRRQIRVLSAEGRLSAVILAVLPVAIAGYISVVNPGYLTKLFDTSTGRLLIGAALALMGAGVLWLRKIIKINV